MYENYLKNIFFVFYYFKLFFNLRIMYYIRIITLIHWPLSDQFFSLNTVHCIRNTLCVYTLHLFLILR